jgi:hypothetical protein
MDEHIGTLKRRCVTWFFGLSVMGLLLSSCQPTSNVSELEWHRPRLSRPHFQSAPQQLKPIGGLFVDVNSNATVSDGKSWDTAFRTIQEAVDVCSGQDIYVAAGTYKSPDLNLRDRINIRLVGGYKAFEKFEKNRDALKDDEWTIFDGQGLASPLVQVLGGAEQISFAGGFIFQNVTGSSAVVIKGNAAHQPVKEVSITNSKFINNANNVALGNGGGIDAQYVHNLRLHNLTAQGNQAKDTGNWQLGGHGGFMRIADVDGLYLMGGAWHNNEAMNGGALHLARITRLTMSGQRLTANRATFGGGIYLTNIRDQQIKNISFMGNQGVDFGGDNRGAGMIIESCHSLRLSGLSFIDNKLDVTVANAMGGAIYVQDSIAITFDFGLAVLKGNHAIDGGAIAINQGGATAPENIIIEGGKFANNQADKTGGAIYALNTNGLEIRNGTFNGHKAYNGATAFISGPAGKIRVSNVHVSNGHATLPAPLFPPGMPPGSAGGIYITGKHPQPGLLAPTIMVDNNSKFIDNDATGNGGALMAHDISYKVEIKDSIFLRNTSKNFGGALALDGRTSPNSRFIIDQGVQFIENRSARGAGGGALYVVFNQAHAGRFGFPGNPVLAENRQLVFYNTITDHRDNTTGDVMVPNLAVLPVSAKIAVAGTAGNYGTFMRVGNAAVDSITPPDRNGGVAVFMSPARLLGPPPVIPRMAYFISYSVDPADNTKPWNLLKLNWEASQKDVYAW